MPTKKRDIPGVGQQPALPVAEMKRRIERRLAVIGISNAVYVRTVKPMWFELCLTTMHDTIDFITLTLIGAIFRTNNIVISTEVEEGTYGDGPTSHGVVTVNNAVLP